MNRREAIRAGLAGVVVGSVAGANVQADSTPRFDFSSDLIYLTPQRSDGQDSGCQAEVWFVAVEGALYVVTASDAWRAQAIRLGLTDTRIWVGDVGQWQSADGAYQQLPQLMASGSLVAAKPMQDRVLEALGTKYSLSWLMWGPRFRNGLADGSRVMLRYTPA